MASSTTTGDYHAARPDPSRPRRAKGHTPDGKTEAQFALFVLLEGQLEA
jgi:hypothetical protein